MNNLFKQMEEFALEHNVPIIKEHERKLFIDIIQKYKPKNILEIGTAIGYSTLLMAMYSKTDVNITTLELSLERATTAQKFINQSNYQKNINIIIGDAGEILLSLNPKTKFDLVFIDAAKGQYPDYLKKILPILADEGVIIADNVLFRGYVRNEGKPPRRFKTIVKRIRQYLTVIENNADFETTIYENGDGLAVSKRINKNK